MTLSRFVTKNAFRNKRRSTLTVLSIALSLLLADADDDHLARFSILDQGGWRNRQSGWSRATESH